jgi:hypothetical protein
MRHRPFLLAAAALGAAAIPAVPALGQAPTPPGATTLNLREVDRGSTFKFIDHAPKTRRGPGGFPRRISAGDQFVFTNPVVDGASNRVGTLRVSCIAPVATRTFDLDCLGVFRLNTGNIWVAASTPGTGSTTTGAIIGGTGAYVGARGTFVSVEDRTGSNDTFTLLP